jgi:hypothetical protein
MFDYRGLAHHAAAFASARFPLRRAVDPRAGALRRGFAQHDSNITIVLARRSISAEITTARRQVYPKKLSPRPAALAAEMGQSPRPRT